MFLRPAAAAHVGSSRSRSIGYNGRMLFCLFDIDGTLITTGGAGRMALEMALAAEFNVADVDHRVDFAGRTDRAIVRDLLRAHALEDSQENWQRFLKSYLARLPDNLAQREGSVLPGVEPLLERLAKRSDVTLGLLTGNVQSGAWKKLEYYGLAHFFQFGAFGDRHYQRNEVAQEALIACRKLAGNEPRGEHIWVIGDTPNDVLCARAIGARCVAVATGVYSRDQLDAAEPDLLLGDLDDTQRILDAIG